MNSSGGINQNNPNFMMSPQFQQMMNMPNMQGGMGNAFGANNFGQVGMSNSGMGNFGGMGIGNSPGMMNPNFGMGMMNSPSNNLGQMGMGSPTTGFGQMGNMGNMGNMGVMGNMPGMGTSGGMGMMDQNQMMMNMMMMNQMNQMNQSGFNNQMNQSGFNQSGMMQANMANIAQLEQQRMIEEDEKIKKEKEEIEKELNEEIQKLLLEKRENQVNRPIDFLIVQPELFYERDHFFFEELIMQVLMTEGVLGMDPVRIDKKKILGDKGEVIQEFNQDYFDKMKFDGCYIDIIKKQINSYNLQKVEQRCLRESKYDWFKMNGDLRLENDIFVDQISKPLDISLTINDKLLMRTLSAALCQKTSSRNFKTYGMKMFISKLVFLDHPLFCDEDHSALGVKEAYKSYYIEMNQLVIPFLKKKIEAISAELEIYSKIRNPSEAIKEEIRNMRIFIDESMQFLDNKKRVLNDKANELYNKWLELKNIRTKQVFQSTNVRLNVLRFPTLYKDNPHIFDYAFVITYTEPTTDRERLGAKEVERRESVKKYKIYLKIYINDVFVVKSKTYEIKWPNFEVDINNLFEFSVFTRPTKIEIEVYMGTFLMDPIARFEIEAPGIFMNTVTSATSLLEEVDFESKTDEEKQNLHNETNKEIELTNKLENKNEEDAKLLDNNIQIKDEKKDRKIKGRIMLKAEWDGSGPDLPPTKIENKVDLMQKQKDFHNQIIQKQKYDYPYDINDPRNVGFFELMKKLKTEMFLKYLNKEYLLPLYDVDALRHYLYLKRSEKISLKAMKIPILHKEIQDDKEIFKIMAALLTEDTNKNEKDHDSKVKEKLSVVNKLYSGKVLSEEEYFQMLNKKVRIMKKDLVTRQQLAYKQVVSEFEIAEDPAEFCKDFIRAVFTPPRKMKPKRVKKYAEKIEKCTEITIGIHIVKGYNVPVRHYSTPYSEREIRKKGYIADVYKSGLGLGAGGQQFMNNSARKNDLNMSGGFNNPMMFNPMAMMQQPNNMMMNPSFTGQLYNLPGAYMGGMRKERYDDIFELVDDLDREERNVESFVQIRMTYYDQELEMRTDSISGVHPDYNYKFQFKIKPKDNEKYFTREELGKTTGAFYFTVYDEVRTDSRIYEKVANTYKYRFEKKYVGSFSVPFSTIFQNGSSMLESMCRVTVPLTLFGYYSDTSSHYIHDHKSEEDAVKSEEEKKREEAKEKEEIPKIVNPNVSTYVSLYITLDPPLESLGGEEVDYVPGFEDSIFLINSSKVLKGYILSKGLKNRHVRLFAENFDGYSVFIPRYVKAQKPPDIVLLDNDLLDPYAIQKAARFVSLIPFIDDSKAFDEFPDCWCTSEQFFTLGFGDYEEHAVLLCNYFLYIESVQKKDISTYLLLGKAHPEGETTYVLRIHNKTYDIEIWNAKTGECYYFNKEYQISYCLCIHLSKHFVVQKSELICQMKEIGCVISDKNIYINIQDNPDPSLMEFNLEDTSCWLPFLNDEKSRKKYFPDGIATIQKDLFYESPNDEEALELTEKIYDFLKKKIEITRASFDNNGKPLRTRWERTVSQKKVIENRLFEYDTFFFKNFVPPLQQDKNMIKNLKIEQFGDNMKKLYKIQKEIENEFPGVKEVYGFPINVSFTTLNSLWEDIRATDIHMVADEESELSLSVNVTAYPSRIFSVWIFFCVLKK